VKDSYTLPIGNELANYPAIRRPTEKASKHRQEIESLTWRPLLLENRDFLYLILACYRRMRRHPPAATSNNDILRITIFFY